MLRREIDEGSMFPDPIWGIWPYGVAWDEPRICDLNYKVVCYPIPWNWVRALTHWLTWKLRVPTPLRGRIIEAQQARAERAEGAWAHRLQEEYASGFIAAMRDHDETVATAMHYCPWPGEDTTPDSQPDSWDYPPSPEATT